MSTLVFFLLVFLIISIIFLFIHLVMGKFIRPSNPEADKLTIYECGEPTIGSAWVQFDVRYYVIALLFVIFDVEVAFFFPWAITFGKANDLAQADLSVERRKEISNEVLPATVSLVDNAGKVELPHSAPISEKDASALAWTAMIDIVVFFGVLLVGYAYLWKRGDIDWVKTVAAEEAAEPVRQPSVLPKPSAFAKV
jgi:NADH-quinone oxidoreductase subunit A